MFLLNRHGHYFEVNDEEVAVNIDQLEGCRLFDDETSMLKVVCDESGLDIDDVAGHTFHITTRNGTLVLIDDRGMVSTIEEPLEAFLAGFEL